MIDGITLGRLLGSKVGVVGILLGICDGINEGHMVGNSLGVSLGSVVIDNVVLIALLEVTDMTAVKTTQNLVY